MPGQNPDLLQGNDSVQVLSDTVVPLFFAGSSEGTDLVVGGDALVSLERIAGFHPGWYFLYLLVLLGLLAWVRIYYGNILTQTLQAAVNFKLATRMFLDNSLLQKQLDNILYLFYILSTAFLLLSVEERLGFKPYGLEGGLLFAFNVGLLSGLFLARVILLNLTGFLFNRLRLFREYLYNTFIFNKIAGVLMTPVLILILYTREGIAEVSFWIAMAILLLIVLARIFRGLIYSLEKNVLIFYMFLYLCALEIVPLVLLYRWLEGIL